MLESKAEPYLFSSNSRYLLFTLNYSQKNISDTPFRNEGPLFNFP